MGSSQFARLTAVLPFTPAADYTDKKGYLVDLAADVATISGSATVPAKGIILEGDNTDGQVSVGILGAGLPPVFMVAGGAITKGDAVIQNNDGTVVTDTGSGARVKVGIAVEDAAEDEVFEVAPITPQVLA